MIPHNKPTLGTEEDVTSLRVLHSGWLAQGTEVESFENEFCNYLGISLGQAVAVSSGTAALFLALWVLNAKNKEVAYSAYACSALRHATAMAGGKEIIVDVENTSPNTDLYELNKKQPDIAIVPHMFGLPINIAKISKEIKVVEDCAQALGAKVQKKLVGLHGTVGIFSFYATKLITSGGQGGMVVSNDKSLIAAIRDYREFDCRRNKKNRFNFQMTDIQAAIGRAQLKKLPQFLLRRNEIFERYKQAGFALLDTNDREITPVRYRAVLRTKYPRKILNGLNRIGVKAIVPIENWELLAKRPNAVKLSKTTVSLPLYPMLKNNEIDQIIKEVKSL